MNPTTLQLSPDLQALSDQLDQLHEELWRRVDETRIYEDLIDRAEDCRNAQKILDERQRGIERLLDEYTPTHSASASFLLHRFLTAA